MKLLTSAPATSQPEVSAPLLPASTPQQPRLKMVWHKEWDGKRERLVAQWVIDR